MSKLFQPVSKPFRLRPALVLCLFATAWIPNASYADSVRQPDLTLQRLSKVGLFAFGGVGFAGVTSQGEKDYREIVARSSGEADFEKLYAIGTPEAKCYALVGLYKLNRAKFDTLSATLRSSQKQVSTAHGCLLWQVSLMKIVEQIQTGAYAE